MQVRDVVKDINGVRTQVTIDHEGKYLVFDLTGSGPEVISRGDRHSRVYKGTPWIPKNVFSQMVRMAWGIYKQAKHKEKIEEHQMKFTGILDPDNA